MDYRNNETPAILQEFLSYHEVIRNHSEKTVDEYFLDLRIYFRWLLIHNHLVDSKIPFDDISIANVDLSLVSNVTLNDIYEFLSFLNRDLHNSAATRSRKIAALRSFYKYLTNKAHLIKDNPVQDLDSPKQQKSLPRYLSLDDSIKLLESVKGKNSERDYCILTLFLNCGVRISELVGINLSDIHSDHIRVLGKGNKVRQVYLNDACIDAINSYLVVRKGIVTADKAFFLSSRRERITRAAVHKLVKKHLLEAGLDATTLSAHKLRHTAATLMLKNGVDVRTLQEILGHEHLNTTQIYTHVEDTEIREASKANPLSKMKRKNK